MNSVYWYVGTTDPGQTVPRASTSTGIEDSGAPIFEDVTDAAGLLRSTPNLPT